VTRPRISPEPPRSTPSRVLARLAPERARLAAALGFTAVLSASTAAFAYLMGPLLQGLLSGRGPDHGSPIARMLPGGAADLVVALPVALVVLAMVKSGAQFAQSSLVQVAGARITARLRRDLYEKLLVLPPAFFQDQHSGELFNRFSTDVNNVETAVTVALVSYIKDPLTIAALLCMCALLDWRLLLVLCAAVPLAVGPIVLFARRLKRIARSSQGALGKVTERVSEVLAQVRIVQAYRQEAAELVRFDSAQSSYLAEMRKSFALRAAFTPVLETLGVVGLALALFVAAQAIAAGSLSPAHLLSFLAAAMLLYQPVKALSGNGQLVVTALASAERLFEILDADLRVEPADAAQVPPLARELRFEKVAFGYEDAPVLRGLDLTLRRGERVALVGESGAGKTTIANLLLGFWRPDSGRILVDGVDLARASLSSWRAQLALVGQEPVLFSGTVRENLCAGRPQASEAELLEVCEAAGVQQPLDAPVGERGALLSGGQRQRLSLARALLRAAPLLILDEATSALDSESEQHIEATIARLLEGRTALIIAHRLSTIRRCDRIAVLEGGRIVEEGDHDALLARGGVYARLWRSFVGAQAA